MRRVFAAALLALAACNAEAAPPLPPSPSPPAPIGDGASFTQATPTAISIKWRPVPGAVDYRVVRSGKQLQLVEDTQIRFHDMGLSPGREYSYVVEALGADGALLKKMSVSGKTADGDPALTETDQVPGDVVKARSLGQFGWTPNSLYDSCPKWLHDSFWTFGPDNKAYPTWHPPVYEYPDGNYCTFGHEHGQDPRGSNLYATVGDIPFGYVNEQMQGKPTTQRNEDHVGHKVAFFNGLIDGRGGTTPVCDVYFKLHQGTHSPDALRNNTHERFLNYRCGDFEARFKSLQPFGHANSFTEGEKVVNTSGAVPADQPSGADRRSMPSMAIMDHAIASRDGPMDLWKAWSPCDNCAGSSEYQNELKTVPGISLEGWADYWVPIYNSETWQGGPTVSAFRSGERVFQWEGGPYWNLANPSRYYDPDSPDLIGRQIDLCYRPTSVIYESNDCKLVRYRGNGEKVPWDSPKSPFNGAIRFNEGNFVGLLNALPENRRPYFTVYGSAPSTPAGILPQKRSSQYPIRQFFSFTGSAKTGAAIGNWAGTKQCGGSACWTNFGFYKLKNGKIIDAGVHAPN